MCHDECGEPRVEVRRRFATEAELQEVRKTPHIQGAEGQSSSGDSELKSFKAREIVQRDGCGC